MHNVFNEENASGFLKFNLNLILTNKNEMKSWPNVEGASCVRMFVLTAPVIGKCLNNKLTPQGMAGNCLCGSELALNKAHACC